MRLVVEICRGIHCSQSHSADLAREWEQLLGVKEGGSVLDGQETVLCAKNCFARCIQGPNLRINGRFFHEQYPGSAQTTLSQVTGTGSAI
ncbi:MAG: NAD(P)H-dependent oxidoreductase subunit E [candidate division FCPU426 bacterium]